ncbi:hypothetical protein PZ895_18215 [Mesorhizobium sp. YIM 152430]|uniref:hypothetical protein n=1 Tax=Mesorhizobium sp. YIM 152430 TaxID=3031761 RepID=UPI0023DC6329|nr:hypothetical protein [Mesorhizobium sp. YIM 152430]MDF1601696.1 hypothetical protein [Mesorhizobium sp. YIM 152430]
MDRDTRNSAIAAAVILAGVGLVAYFMPAIMLAAIEVSPWLAGAVAGLFLVAFFMIFWLRGRFRR